MKDETPVSREQIANIIRIVSRMNPVDALMYNAEPFQREFTLLTSAVWMGEAGELYTLNDNFFKTASIIVACYMLGKMPIGKFGAIVLKHAKNGGTVDSLMKLREDQNDPPEVTTLLRFAIESMLYYFKDRINDDVSGNSTVSDAPKA